MLSLPGGSGPQTGWVSLTRDELSWTIFLSAVSREELAPFDEAKARHWLSAVEYDQQFAAMSSRRRVSYLMGRVAAKTALGRAVPDCSPRGFHIGYGAMGEPILTPPHSHFGISLAHTDDSAVAVTYPQELVCGIDLETVRPRAEKAIESQMNVRDQKCLEVLPMDAVHALTMGWTIKEAVAKALRVGMSAPFSALTIATIEALSETHWRARMQVPGALVVFIWRERNHYLSLCVPDRISLSDFRQIQN